MPYTINDTIINFYGKDQLEVIRYHSPFFVPTDIDGVAQAHPRKFVKLKMDGMQVLVPKRDSVRLADLQKSIQKSSVRAQDMYYGYALANEWDYFVTLTVSPKNGDRKEDALLMYLWKMTRLQWQRYDKAVRILCAPERHRDGCLHLHMLVGTDKSIPIIPMSAPSPDFNTFDSEGGYTQLPETNEKYYLLPFYKDGVQERMKKGDPLWCLSFYRFGRNAVGILPKDETSEGVINYLIQYTTKAGNLGYNKKRFFRTQNLNFKDKLCLSVNEDDLAGILADYGLKPYKIGREGGFTVYRNFNNQNPVTDACKPGLSELPTLAPAATLPIGEAFETAIRARIDERREAARVAASCGCNPWDNLPYVEDLDDIWDLPFDD